MTPLRTALFQGPCGVPASLAESVAALAGAAREAVAGGARLLVAPELYLSGYGLDAVQLDQRAEPADGPGAVAVAGLAREHGLAIAYGYPERHEGTYYNSAQLIGPDGLSRAHYRKTHLYGEAERASYTPGGELVVQTELDGLRLGLLICYDVEFPEAVRAHALAGTDLLLVPTALMRPYGFVAETIVPARAWENQLYIAYANRCGPESGQVFAGLSTLAPPDGAEPARAGEEPELLLTEVDPALLAASRAQNPYLRDRRPALYPAAP